MTHVFPSVGQLHIHISTVVALKSSEVVVGHRPIRSLASRGPGPSATLPEQAAAQKLKESLAMKGKPVTWTSG